MGKISRQALVASAMLGLFSAGALHGAVVASDNAGNSPYVAGTADIPQGSTGADEFGGLNGGTGFNAWVVTDVENAPATGATTSNGAGTGNGSGFINSATNDATRNPAPVFDIFDNGNPNTAASSTTGATLGSSIATATRSFQTPLTGAGSSLSFTESLANLRGMNNGTATSQVGFELLDSANNVLLNLYANGGGPGFFAIDAAHPTGYELMSTDAAHSGASARALTINSGAADTITFTLNDATGDYTISSTGHEGSTFADGGMINMSTGGPDAFAVYDNNGGQGSDVRFNALSESIAVTPEPACAVLGMMGVGLLARRRQHR